MTRIALWAVLAGALTTVVLVTWRGFPWQLALIIALGVAALVYSSIRTFRNLKNLHRH